ncbi:MAG: hypothetical protein GTN59_08550 [Candidatus Dadabacteria bacterium]|nr:hypothetical protein [Candidatus Dadabacteria bacterium]
MGKRHHNRYRYWYDKIYTIDDMKEYFGDGWHELLENAFFLVSHFPDAQICSAKRCYGMLHMYARCDDDLILEAVEGILWKIERMSSQVCEGCGKMGRRRTELKTTYCFCNNCYLEYLNKAEDPMTLFMEGREGRFGEE